MSDCIVFCFLFSSVVISPFPLFSFFFFFNDTATTEIYTLSLHDALPIFRRASFLAASPFLLIRRYSLLSFLALPLLDRKSTRLNSSHDQISYAVFCLKKKKNNKTTHSLN